MTIQVSVLIWTVICFCLLMLILDRLLFRPILAFMDKRNARIRRAQEMKAQREREAAQRAEALAAAREAALREAEAKALAETEAAQKAAEQAVAEAEEAHFRRLGEETAVLERENREMTDKLSGITDDLARSFAERLTIGL